MFKAFLYELIEIVARLHERFLALNDAHNWALSDKMLHFYVIGIIGMAVVFIIHPLFKYLGDGLRSDAFSGGVVYVHISLGPWVFEEVLLP